MEDYQGCMELYKDLIKNSDVSIAMLCSLPNIV